MVTIEYDAADKFQLDEALQLWNRTLPGHTKRLISIFDKNAPRPNSGRSRLMIQPEAVPHLRGKGFQFEIV
jgi:hypothetical protein